MTHPCTRPSSCHRHEANESSLWVSCPDTSAQRLVRGSGRIREIVLEPFSDEHSWLHGFALAGIAGISVDSEAQVGPLAKMNFLVGRNNHGKSTLMRAAAQWTTVRSGGNALGVRRTLVPIKRDSAVQLLRSCSVRSRDEQEQRLSSLLPMEDEWLGVWVERSNASNS